MPEWTALAELGEPARQLAASASGAQSFAESLVRAEHHEDAVRFLAYVLPARQGVLWAWSCAKAVTPANAPAPVFESLAATEQWIAQPTDEHRRTAMSAAQKAEVGTPAGAAGLAAFLSGETLAAAGMPLVPPAPFLASKAVAASIMLSAVSSEPENAPMKYRSFLLRGFELAQRTQLWESITNSNGKER